MGRIRTIKPEFYQSEELSALPSDTHLLAGALLPYADDEGYFRANPDLIKAACSPLRKDSVSTHDSLIMLSNVGYIRLGTAEDGKRYGQITNFLNHQRINRPTPSKIKHLKITWDDSPPNHQQLSEASPTEGNGREQGTGNREGNGTDLRERARTMHQNMALGTILHFAKFKAEYPKPSQWELAEQEWRIKNLDAIAEEIILPDLAKRKAEHAYWKKIRFIPNPENYLEKEMWKHAIIPNDETDERRTEWAGVGTLTGAGT